LPDSGNSVTSGIETGSPRIDFSVLFDEPGEYYLWVRGTGTDSGSDSVHFGVDGEVQATATSITGFSQSGVMGWSNALAASGSPATLEIPSAGLHAISVWMAEDGFTLDKFVLTKDSAFVPSGLGPAVSLGGTLPEYPVVVDSHKAVWNFTEDPAYGEAADGIASHDLTCTNCPVAAQGIGDPAFAFASNRFMTLADAAFLDASNNQGFSVETLVRFGSTCSTEQGIVGRSAGASPMRWALGCQSGKVKAQLVDSSGNAGAVLTSVSSIDDGDWHHVVLVRDARFQETALYIDGVLEQRLSQSLGAFDDASAALDVGRADFGAGYRYLNADVDSLALHGRALRGDEIARAALALSTGMVRGLWGCEAPVRVMPLGDSITAGSNGDGSKIFGTYRVSLYEKLLASGYNVDFVGSATERHSESIDKNHEGWPGDSSYHVRNAVFGYLSMNPADLVLLHIGTNSVDTALGGTRSSLNVIDTFDTLLPVVVARIINKQVPTSDTHDYNEALEAEVISRIGTGDRLFLVDMETILDPATDYYDNLHPNTQGAAKMAAVWFDELTGILPRCRPATPELLPATTLGGSIGAAFRFTPEVLGHPTGTFSLSNQPSGMTVNPETGEVRWLSPSAGTHAFTVAVSNATGADSRVYTVTID